MEILMVRATRPRRSSSPWSDWNEGVDIIAAR
jgi:hypothetical protein